MKCYAGRTNYNKRVSVFHFMKWNAHKDNAFTVLLNIQGKVKIPTMSQPSFSSCAQKNANFFQSISIVLPVSLCSKVAVTTELFFRPSVLLL